MTFGHKAAQLARKAVSYMSTALSLLRPEQWKGVMSTPSASGKTVGAHNALTLSTVWACVRLVAGTISSLPIVVTVEKKGGFPEADRSHPLYSLLHDSPNADQSALDFWQFICVSLELWGNAYARITRGRGGKIVALTPIRPELMMVRRAESGQLVYRWTDGAERHEALQAEIFHIRGFGGSPLGGLSPLAFGRESFGLALATEEAAAHVYRNGMRTSGVLQTENNQVLKEQDREDLYKYVVAPLMGENSGRPIILEAGLKWQTIAISPGDAQMIESRRFSVEDGCRWFQVPPHMIGHTAGNTHLGSSIEQQTLGFLIFSLRERLKRIEHAIRKQLLTPAERLTVSVEFNFEGLLRADSAARSEFYAKMVQNGIMTRNEVRRLEGLAPVPGGDALTIQSNMIPADKLGEMTSTAGNSAKDALLSWLGLGQAGSMQAAAPQEIH